jgi:hypothetical protein
MNDDKTQPVDATLTPTDVQSSDGRVVDEPGSDFRAGQAREDPEVRIDAEAPSSGTPGATIVSEPETTGAGRDEEVIDLEAVSAGLAESRASFVSQLFASERPTNAVRECAREGYAAALRQAVDLHEDPANEAAKLLTLAQERHRSTLATESSELLLCAEEAERYRVVFDTLFIELEGLTKQVDEELQRLDVNSPTFLSAPEPLQGVLSNLRQGVEIIHRMLFRLRDRKKPLEGTIPELRESFDAGPPPDHWEAIIPFGSRLFDRFHELRDANYHAVQDARKLVDEWKKATHQAVKQFLSAVDGIDGGLQNEQETRAGLRDPETAQPESVALMDAWFGAYPRLFGLVEAYCARTGLMSHRVVPGTVFDPETMEPQGTVARPEFKDEDVAAVVRRGFSLNGERIRPILVEVVRNP